MNIIEKETNEPQVKPKRGETWKQYGLNLTSQEATVGAIDISFLRKYIAIFETQLYSILLCTFCMHTHAYLKYCMLIKTIITSMNLFFAIELIYNNIRIHIQQYLDPSLHKR